MVVCVKDGVGTFCALWADIMFSVRKILPLVLLASCATDGGFNAGSTLRSLDNDAFGHTDDQYTSGLAISYVSQPSASFEDTSLPESIGELLEERWLFDDEDQRFVIYSLSHRSFTPTDLTATALIENDLPYSSSLYGTVVVGSQNRDSLNALSLSVGVVGPLAFGEELQSATHELIDSKEPQGWDNQLENEPLLNIGVDARRRLATFGERDGFGGDLLGGVSASLGNLQTQASVATTLRAGYGVPSNFHMQTPFLTEVSLGLRAYDKRDGRWSAYGFAGVGATVLANAIYLDGNTFRDSHSVSHDHFVARGSVGLALRYRRILLALSLEAASIPWDQAEGLDFENYGRIGLSWDF